MELVERSKCTACSSCMIFCPQHAISMVKDQMGNIYPKIDQSKCVECGICEKVCHAQDKTIGYQIQRCYAVYSSDEEIRRKSASGGMAAELYRWAISKGYICAGVSMNSSYEAHFMLFGTMDEIPRVQNSKYTFSYLDQVIKDGVQILKQGRGLLFVGLPCQNAAMRKAAEVFHAPKEQLYCADIVCHGVPSGDYLQEHIASVAKGKNIVNISFRDPAYKTSSFVLSLTDADGRKYHKKVESNDSYQIAYHSASFYRENCYQCQYANQKRMGDLTIGDFPSVGKTEPAPFEAKDAFINGISCVLTNTDKGNEVLQQMIDRGSIRCFDRPLEEATQYEAQLQMPSSPSRFHDTFFTMYPELGFEASAGKVFRKEKLMRPISRLAKDIVKRIIGKK